MTGGLDVSVKFCDFTFFVDHKSAAFYPHGLFAVFVFLNPDSIFFGDGMLDIGKKLIG